MTYAPQSYKNARAYIVDQFDMHPRDDDHGADLDPAEVGIVGSAKHVRTGTSYHLGKSQLKMSRNPYSARLARDRRGLTDGAAALDIGSFSRRYPNGRTADRAHLSTWLVRQCQAGAADTAWIREIIYSTDGRTVLRYDRERGRTSAPRAGEADSSHTFHTHVSGYRDCENVDKTAVFRRYVREISGAAPVPAPPAPAPAAPPFPGRVLAYAPGRPIMRGQDVQRWQAQMARRGWRITADGEYGPKSRDVALAFQAEKKLTRDGKVGPQTWRAAWTAKVTK